MKLAWLVYHSDLHNSLFRPQRFQVHVTFLKKQYSSQTPRRVQWPRCQSCQAMCTQQQLWPRVRILAVERSRPIWTTATQHGGVLVSVTVFCWDGWLTCLLFFACMRPKAGADFHSSADGGSHSTRPISDATGGGVLFYGPLLARRGSRPDDLTAGQISPRLPLLERCWHGGR